MPQVLIMSTQKQNWFILEPNTDEHSYEHRLGCPEYCGRMCYQLCEVFISIKEKKVTGEGISSTLVATAGRWSQDSWGTSAIGLPQTLCGDILSFGVGRS